MTDEEMAKEETGSSKTSSPPEQKKINDYTYKIPIGPQHPALKEAVHLRFEVDGEKVVNVTPRLGYAHRGIEQALSTRPYDKGLFLSERICGICSNCHTTTYAQAIEKIARTKIPDRARFIRTIFNELERLASHTLWAGVAAHEIGFDTPFMYLWRDREHILNYFEKTAGNRVNKGINILGGVRYDLTPEHLKDLEALIPVLRERFLYYKKIFIKDSLVKKRTSGVGKLSKRDAKISAATGPHCRASGIKYDIRFEDDYLAYGATRFSLISDDGCDVFSRVKVRILEMMESLKIIESCLDLPNTPLATKIKPELKGDAVSRIEAQRGELFYFVRANGPTPDRVRIRTPSYANFHSLPFMFKNETVADIPIVVASMDPCISCTDRVIIADEKGERIVTKQQLKAGETGAAKC